MTNATERVGRYQLLEPIGVGPTGAVSRAKVFGVAGFERQFAVKRFHNELTASPQMAAALSAAARGYGSLEHPRIARMSEFGVAQGTTFTAVEYVAGLDALRLVAEARLAGMTLAAGGALALVSQAARAVGYAHGRGLSHLGLAPTNVIVTAEGDVKITDFGILAASLPPRPIDSVRLAHRIQYLAPEQLANEATSAATDVFALGVLAYELVTGQRTFKGETPAQIAQSVMSGPPAEPPLPRPIVRVLQRCLARSPFERFPDARALADALDAALRVAPVPGTRKDIGAQVTQTLERLSALNEGQQSGMLALDIGTGPIAKAPEPAPTPTLGRESQEGMDVSTLEFVRPDAPVPGPTPLVGPSSLAAAAAAAGTSPTTNPATTMPDLPKPFTTVPGLAPPPIPVPQGVAPPSDPPPPPTPGGATTLLGVANAKSAPAIPLAKLDLKPGKKPAANVPNVPSVPRTATGPTYPRAPTPPPTPTGPAYPRAATPPPIPRVAAPPPIPRMAPEPSASVDEAARTGPRSERPSALMRAIEEADVIPPSSIGLPLPLVEEDTRERGPVTDPGLGFTPQDYGGGLPAPQLTNASTNATNEVLGEPAWQQAHAGAHEQEFVDEVPPAFTPRAPTPAPAPAPASSAQLASPRPGAPASSAQLASRRPSAPAPRSRLPWILGGAVGVAALGVGGWFGYHEFVAKKQPAGGSGSASAHVAKAPRDAGAQADAKVAVVIIDAPEAAAPDAQVATATPDAAVTTADAAVVAEAIDAGAPKPTPSDQLVITSTPKGARVFLDGADAGTTPLKLPGSPDRHTIAVILPSHELYVAQVDGQGSFAIPLKEVTPLGGPAGIKVIRCKDKERYYVFVDGKPTGMTCPTERIEVEKGPHTVEVYDAVTDARKKFDIEVKDTRLSYRVRIE